MRSGSNNSQLDRWLILINYKETRRYDYNIHTYFMPRPCWRYPLTRRLDDGNQL